MASKIFKANEGEFGFVHTFNVKEEDGTASDITWSTGRRLVILDGTTVKLDTTSNMIVVPNDKVQWTVPINSLNFNGENLDVVLHFTATGRLEKTYDFLGIITKKKV